MFDFRLGHVLFEFTVDNRPCAIPTLATGNRLVATTNRGKLDACRYGAVESGTPIYSITTPSTARELPAQYA